jgi:signal transduction histidine kinase
MVETAAAERRRIERNLHDGAQQRLVSVAYALGLARSRLLAGEAQAGLAFALDDARAGLAMALDELRSLAQGIHPGVLTECGLRTAIEELGWGAPMPVELRWDAPERLPASIELVAYYVVAESLTNAAKHAQATRVTVEVSTVDSLVRVTVADDGCGGATLGTGLRGLADRASSLGGTLTIHSGPDGTAVQAVLPCG